MFLSCIAWTKRGAQLVLQGSDDIYISSVVVGIVLWAVPALPIIGYPGSMRAGRFLFFTANLHVSWTKIIHVFLR